MSSLRGHSIVIGAMKSGTTSLFRWLSILQGIAPSRPKDTKFFLTDPQGGTYSKGLEWYGAQFIDNSDTLWRMEASTHYTKYPDYSGVPKRIRDSLASPRLIYVVRNPVERSLSHFFHNLVVDGSANDINESLACFACKYYYYSDYALQLAQYLEYFDRDVLFVADVLDEGVSEEARNALVAFLDMDGMTSSSSHVLSRENDLTWNIEKRAAQASTKFSRANDRLFYKLREDIACKSHKTLVQLALAFGLRKRVFENMTTHLEEKVLEFEALSGLNWQHWISKYELYL